MAKRRVLDSDGLPIKAGDTIRFSYGIPPNVVTAPVIDRDGTLIALCEGHSPKECPVNQLKRHIGWFHRIDDPEKVHTHPADTSRDAGRLSDDR